VIWALLAFLGVPLWLIALALLGLFFRNRGLRKRLGNIPVRVLQPGKRRWRRGHAIWVSDVFAWRGSPGAWREDVAQVRSVYLHVPDPEQRKKLRRLGDDAVVASLSLADGSSLDVATRGEHRAALPGPFGGATERAERNSMHETPRDVREGR
jgi:hypothetical protein